MVDEDNLLAVRREVERIKDRLDDIGHIQLLEVRTRKEVRDHVMAFFVGAAGRTRASVYLAADGKLGVRGIASAVGVDFSHVAKICKSMQELGLLGSEGIGSRKVYYKTALEDAFHITKALKRLANDT